MTDLCGVLDIEWGQNWKETRTGHCLGDVDVDEQVVVGKQAGSHPASGHYHFNHHHRLLLAPFVRAFLIDKMQLKSKISDAPKEVAVSHLQEIPIFALHIVTQIFKRSKFLILAPRSKLVCAQ